MAGRKLGYRKNLVDYKTQYTKEIELLKKGLSIRDVSNFCHKSPNTILKIKKLFL